ncbi:LysR family transcriptional regulator [Caulobacter sp. Root487D2Y]|jgi:DNA-binding transcriptional LysR family regulator|uniref:LysR family transcriptional regulator n=1 Tax=Caulobacter sp. Root487D2Y TaxID=1736547 RepID=UPI0006F9A725|nr:LysR family transcriptional regulator [Caulobacter sp. Root487D2Y]KQY35344.1 LysR family transcriptional regulator [Caulobacter sp. Root487D2Y]
MQRDLLDGVVAFTTVARRRSFTVAAADLGVTPAAVSHAVKQLEARLGVVLFARTTREVGLTEAGRRYLQGAQPAVEAMEAATVSARSLGEGPAGTVRLTTSRLALRMLLAPVITDFSRAYPDVRLEVVVDDASISIIEEGFDVGVRMGEMIAPDMVAVRVSQPFRFCVVGAPALLQRWGRPEHPRDLKAIPCLNVLQTTRRNNYRWEFEEDGREFEVAVDSAISVNDFDFLLKSAIDGLGLTYQPEPLAMPHVMTGRLERVLDSYLAGPTAWHLYYPSRLGASAPLRAFVEFMRGRLRVPGRA